MQVEPNMFAGHDIYTYAVALSQGAAILPANLAGMRAKAISKGHTEGQCQIVERDPMRFIKTGELAA
ncbi:hypothetical protein [Leisingera sp. JC1]|uniref:hypothetical protein n=1 Tax=Leisingera sp. JC1 TaxID=1855282 RepID=UPI001130128F|nr:hypothetical protein [Leisingera sp. JC1]